MKKTIYNIFTFLIVSFSVTIMTGCDDNDRDSLLLTDEVDILLFEANGVEGQIDEANNIIQLFYPKGTDLTNLTPEIRIPSGATVTPASGEKQDLSKVVRYRVVNGSVYKDYNVIAAHIKGQILSFSIGKYKGVIDHDAGTINVRYPKDGDMTNLTPVFTITDGATVTPQAGTSVDFTNPG